jgi:hypothetical protein
MRHLCSALGVDAMSLSAFPSPRLYRYAQETCRYRRQKQCESQLPLMIVGLVHCSKRVSRSLGEVIHLLLCTSLALDDTPGNNNADQC